MLGFTRLKYAQSDEMWLLRKEIQRHGDMLVMGRKFEMYPEFQAYRYRAWVMQINSTGGAPAEGSVQAAEGYRRQVWHAHGIFEMAQSHSPGIAA